MTLSRIAINARLGDGMLGKGKNASITFMSTDKELLELKERMLIAEGYKGIKWGTQRSGYGGTKTIFNLRTFVDERATIVRDISIDALLTQIDELDLILWYLDDGSWHKGANTMHLYSNMLTEHQSTLLVNRIEELYGIRPKINIDRKKDGRQFYYLYFPRDLTKLFRPKVKEFLLKNSLTSLYCKFGGLDYEEKPPRHLTEPTKKAINDLMSLGYSDRYIQNVGIATPKQIQRALKEAI
ncbi:hypothetical protein [Lysinibacillus sp. TE18511]